MVRSLAWRIQLWHALTLATVVAGLGTFVYFRIERATMQQVDTELEGAAQVLVSTLQGLDPAELESGNFSVPSLAVDRQLLPPPGGPPAPPPRHRRQRRRPHSSDLPTFIIWRADGSVLKAADNAPSLSFDEVPTFPDASTALVRRRRDAREAFLPGPHGTVVMVRRSLRRELDDLAQWRWALLAAGCGALAMGVLGGAWLIRRSLRPIAAMSATASAISAENLSARIDTRSIDIELAALAETLNAAFDRLEADFQKQARFTADASHELRTPLTIILGQLDYALAQGHPDDVTREALEASQRAARRMKSLVEQLLLLARADAGKLLSEAQTFDFAASVEECVALLEPLAREKQVELSAELAPAEVTGDPGLLAQVAINLITNAIVHNRPGGSARIAVTTNADFVCLAVADTGPGIPPDAQSHLFERFYRADAARSRASGGAGLGLAISQRIARAHGGELTCTSREGEGAEFVLRLPVEKNGSRAS